MPKQTTKTTAAAVANNKAARNLWPKLANWPKNAGPAPTLAQLNQAVNLGYRAGAANCLAVAMYLRQGGANQKVQVSAACNGPQLNVWRAIRATGKTRSGANVYSAQASHTVQGKRITAYIVRVAKPKAPSKPRKAAKVASAGKPGGSPAVAQGVAPPANPAAPTTA
ncbi:hypothetical protein LCGC14_0232350 [marine sediment metagenome]|uniref:Uncharacterized protein n=1 Tax=marine sediment metagenome TaxID=412755 RepID=A0A0F9UEM0_9ZZZZ